MSEGLTVKYDPKLVEDAVFYSQGASNIAPELAKQRDRIYDLAKSEARDELFRELYRTWFHRLGLGKPVDIALREQPLVASRVNNCYVLCATHTKQEGAELFVASDPVSREIEQRNLRILIRPATLLRAEQNMEFLRHELFHIADMLDPAFAYEPVLPKADGGPTYDTLITNRYRVLWDVTIAGRMLRRGWCGAAVRDYELNNFLNAFAMFQGRCEELFQRFFDLVEPRHAELAAFALDPRSAGDNLSNQGVAGTHCSLCRFPTHTFASEPANLGAELLAAIAEDFPDWTPAKGVCVQCADLYRGRQISLDALRQLPGYISSIQNNFTPAVAISSPKPNGTISNAKLRRTA